MPLHWNNTDTKYAILSAVAPVSAAFLGSMYASKDQNILRFFKNQQYPKSLAPSCQYFYPAMNVATIAPFGYASYLVYKIGGGFDYTDTSVALGLYAATITAGILAVPIMSYKNVKSLAVHNGIVAALAVATSIAFYKIDNISGYWAIPFAMWTVYCASINAKAAGCCGGNKATLE